MAEKTTNTQSTNLTEGAPIPRMQGVQGGDIQRGAPIPAMQSAPSGNAGAATQSPAGTSPQGGQTGSTLRCRGRSVWQEGVVVIAAGGFFTRCRGQSQYCTP